MFLEEIIDYEIMLVSEEKSPATIAKYLHEAKEFVAFLGDRKIDKDIVIEYKKQLVTMHKPRTVNCKLIAVNSFLKYLERRDCLVRTLKVQDQTFLSDDKILKMEEYKKLVASSSPDFALVIETIAMTGIRISELKDITVDSIEKGKADINCKGKSRVVVIPNILRIKLKNYIKRKKLDSGPVFVTKSGKPLDRSNIWRKMKKVCLLANVDEMKVFPHNLRHLFARTFYEKEKDIVKLADILGHSSVGTTRIYTKDSGYKHIEAINRVADLMIHTT